MSAAEFADAAAQHWNLGTRLDVSESATAYVWIGGDVVVRVTRDTESAELHESMVRRLVAAGAAVQRLAGMAPLRGGGWRAVAWMRCQGSQGLSSYSDGCAWAEAILGLHGTPVDAARKGRGSSDTLGGSGSLVVSYMARCAPHLLRVGLSHQDAHSRNVFVYQGRAMLIDLDSLATAPLWWDALELACENAGRVAPEVLRGAHATLGLVGLTDDVVEEARFLRRYYAAKGL